LDYQASIQELEAARHALEDDEDEPPEPTVASSQGGIELPTANPRDPELADMIRSLRQEVNSLHSATSSIYSTTASSIYSSLSTHSNRLSLLVEGLSIDSSPDFRRLQRMSRTTSTYHNDSLSPIRETAYAPEVRRRLSWDSVFAGMQNGLNGTAPWADASVAGELIQTLTRACDALNDEGEMTTYCDLVRKILADLTDLPPSLRNSYLGQLSVIQRRQAASGQPSMPSSIFPESDAGASSAESIYRISMDDSCYKAIPLALKQHGLTGRLTDYRIWIVYGDVERCVGLDEKPLLLFKRLKEEGKEPMFILRKQATQIGAADGLMEYPSGDGGFV
jgi:hypothetical protein